MIKIIVKIKNNKTIKIKKENHRKSKKFFKF